MVLKFDQFYSEKQQARKVQNKRLLHIKKHKKDKNVVYL